MNSKLLNEVKINFEKLLATGNEFEIKALANFLSNKTHRDLKVRRSTKVEVIKTSQAQALLRSIEYLDSILSQGKEDFGDPRKGDIYEYAKNLGEIVKEVDALIKQINDLCKKAISNNIGPNWAIRRYIAETIKEEYGTSNNQAEKLAAKFFQERGQNKSLTIEKFMEPIKTAAQEKNMTIKDYLISKSNEDKNTQKSETKSNETQKIQTVVEETQKAVEVEVEVGLNKKTIQVGEGKTII